ncbi:MAG: TIGR02757 family protein [Bacteroidetes bacterium]|nr:TIGR02757 family protein [Bacteroidota bacterium]MBU1580304.1 TIGR02757 family protein [Bacteroidota bacterium]MBU2466316.1 TIGR02757 family protein [Bacteroidota bacterium]MBU2558128.1 TIGR02757 family protein [Bacteroidota bacterium]
MLIKSRLDEQLRQLAIDLDFVQHDPICVPHQFSTKEDIEIAGLLTALIAWGQRKQIISKAKTLMQLMDNAPFDFLLHATDREFSALQHFQYRTFNGTDCHALVHALAMIYRHHGGLEPIFTSGFKTGDAFEAISDFRNLMLHYPHLPRSEKHLANPKTGAAAKRINMFLRWMVRKDELGIDFGIWENIAPSALICPLDVHSGRAARKLNLLSRKQNDRKAAVELTNSLIALDANDPVKYDLALFYMSVNSLL